MAENERKTWIMYKNPHKYEYIPGAVADWRGVDSPINNCWVDRINNYKLIPTIPEEFYHLSNENCYYNTSFRSYMNSNLELIGGKDSMYTLEIVFRDVKDMLGNQYGGDIWQKGAGFAVSPSGYYGPHIFKIYIPGSGRKNKYYFSIRYRNSGGEHLGIGWDAPFELLQNKKLFSYSYSPNLLSVDGIKSMLPYYKYDSKSTLLSGELILGSYGSQTDRAVKNMKVCAVRWYPFSLTEEQRAFNYEIDKQLYDI